MSNSLWQIEQNLAELMEAREETLAELETSPIEAGLRLQQLDIAIADHVKAEIRKVDGVCGYWRNRKMLIDAGKVEIQRITGMVKQFERQLEVLKSAVQVTMEEMSWTPGKTRKIEGKTGALYLKGNGGRRAVVITDEAMVPDEFCKVVVTMNADEWEGIVAVMRSMVPEADRADAAELAGRLNTRREPSISRIYEALTSKCVTCNGSAGVMNMEPSGDVVEITCSACGGSGTNGVPGAYLAPLGEHVECK